MLNSTKLPTKRSSLYTKTGTKTGTKIGTKTGTPFKKVETKKNIISYNTPFQQLSNYSIPTKIRRINTKLSTNILEKNKYFIESLKDVLIYEKIIDRSNPLFKDLLANQQKFNMMFYKFKPHNIICFIQCDYYLYDKKIYRVFNKNNTEPYYGNSKFNNLLRNHNMGMKWYSENILYIHNNI